MSWTQQNLTNRFSVFPNPANELITIKNTENKIINEISIFDISRKLVDNQQGLTSTSICISKLEKGVYFMNIQNGDGTATIKFVKN